MLKPDTTNILGYINSDEGLWLYYHNNALSFENYYVFLNEITKIANAVLSIAEHEAHRGATKVDWNNKTHIPISLQDDIKAIVSIKSNHSEPIFKIINRIFKNCYNIQSSISGEFKGEFISDFSIKLSWPDNHPLLNPKPSFAISYLETDNLSQSHFTTLFKTGEFADFQICIDGKTIKTHKIMLAQCSYFDTLLHGKWKESEQGVISFDQCNYDTFYNFLSYLYTHAVTNEYFDEINNCLDMVRFTDFVNYLPLKNQAKSMIYQIINEQNFLDIKIVQMELADADLDKLCKWFLKSHPKFGEELDFSSLEIMQLVTTFQIGKANRGESLVQASLEHLKNKLMINNDFIKLCKCIGKMKEPQLKSTLVEVLRAQPQLFSELKEGHADKYKQHWEAFSEVMTDVSF